ncbi:hypothetical protein [Algibacter sp. L3A6]|uniref:hypothetical protein n=1 Tax=Algibacter sp. L3A6 TaxID=2686366 RepID=UPI00131AB431|nr:hypothetical protein [Algibacter sp. L3A6]
MNIYKKNYLILIILLTTSNTYSQYQVWMGTTCTPQNALYKNKTWKNTAKLVEGLNINKTPVKPLKGTPSEGEKSLSLQEFNSVITLFKKGSKNGFVEIARTFFENDAYPNRPDLITLLEKKFKRIDAGGYDVKGIMFFDNYIGSNAKSSKGVVYAWTEAEVQKMRDWLDENRPGTRLYWNARNNSITNRNWCENPLVDDIVMEAKPELWYKNAGSRQTLLKWLWTNPTTVNKRIILQTPVNTMTAPYGNPNGLQQFREFVRWLGVDLMDFEFMRSKRLIIMPVTYNNAFTFYPETINNGKTYANTMTGIALSLIEQRKLFQGIDTKPTKEDAYNISRATSK